MMGGQIDPAWLPILMPILGVEDPDIFLTELLAIRDHMEFRKHAQ